MVLNRLRRIVEAVIAGLFTAMVAAVLLQVFARYLWNQPPSWTEELARYCQVWIILLASSICIRKGLHLRVDYISQHFNTRWRHVLNTTIQGIVLIYSVIVTIYGFRLLIVGRFQVSPAMQVNMSLIYLIFPLSGGLMVLEAGLRMGRMLRGKS